MPSASRVSAAALRPLIIIAPKVGPMRGAPRASETSMPVTIMPGAISCVSSTMASSATFMSRQRMPGSSLIRPTCCRRFTPNAPIGPSWPHAETSILDSITFGSMHDCVSWFCVTSDQLVTTPETRSFLMMRSSTAVALNSFTLGAASTLAMMVDVKSAACFTMTKRSCSSYSMPSSSSHKCAGLRTIMADMSWPPSQAPPPGATDCSIMAILSSGYLLSSYAQLRPAEPAPVMMTSDSAKSYMSFM
mmetsp:Transcript_38369/g.95030  ORF Transcript_38369/g.95030 Transcript_38369/m.95030 type:complete len:247 (-) Transcript_38369:196-936(-)